MHDETPSGSTKGIDDEGRFAGSDGESAPLQSRAHFLENWSWLSVTEINRGLCARSQAQSGIRHKAHQAVAQEWEEKRTSEIGLGETFSFLKSCHRRAPFLFYNGNTFAEIGRVLTNTLFYDLPFSRRKELASVVAHFITGVLDADLLQSSFNSLTRSAGLQAGDPVKTLRGSLRGVILRILEDGRVEWKAKTGTVFTALPESLCADD